MTEFKPKLSLADFEEIHRIVHGARKGTKTVKVSKEALGALLMDHGNALSLLQSQGTRIVENP